MRAYTGNTLVLPIKIISDEITDLNGVDIIFSVINKDTGHEIRKTPVVDGLVVTGTLESHETLIPVVYYIEYRANFNGIVKTIEYDKVLLENANIREAITDGQHT